MELEKYSIQSNFDGLNLEIETVMPHTEEIKGVVQFSHGMAEHKERYEDFMNRLASKGYVSVIHDHRGHGASVKCAEDLGYFYTDDMQGIVEDLHQVTMWAKEKFPGVPFYLFSHSMGTLVARNYLKEYDYELDKLILCGPPVKNSAAGIALVLAKISGKIQGKKHRNRLINSLAFQSYGARFGSEYGWLSADQKNVDNYLADPLCGYIFTNNGFENLFQLMIGAFKTTGWGLKHPSLKIKMIAGSEDPVIENEKKFYEMEKFLKAVGYQRIHSKLYKGLRHELLNEADSKEKIYGDIVRFLDE